MKKKKKKKAAVDLRSLWEKAGKVQRTSGAPTVAPKPPSVLLQCLRFFLQQGLAFQGDDEIEDSLNQGNFPELLRWLAGNLEGSDKGVLQNALNNPLLTSPEMLKDLVNSCARETTRLIMQELGNENFAIFGWLFSDVCHNEQLVVCLRYVDKKGRVVERFIGVVSIESPDGSAIKAAIESLLRDHCLSWSRVRGQGYDGAGNMRAYVKDLKKLVVDESPSAHYVHCFAQELHLALVPVAKENGECADFFEQLGFLVSVLEISCKKAQMLQVAEAQQVLEGLNHEKVFGSLSDSRWEYHYSTVIQIVILYPTIRSVLIMVGEDHTQGSEALNARTILTYFESFEFVFMTHLLLGILGCTSVLNNALQRKDGVLVNAIRLIGTTTHLLDKQRSDHGWDELLKNVTNFCAKNGIKVPSMDGMYEPVLRPKEFFREVKNLHHYHVEIFTSILDRQLQEFNDRFDEVSTDLLVCMAAFDPAHSFRAYDKDKLLKLARFYPKDFSSTDLLHLPTHLTRFIVDMRRDERFREVKSFVELSVMLVETNKCLRHPIVYKLLKLVLVLPVATATVERLFPAMNLVQNKLTNRPGKQLLNGCLVTFIEREFFMNVKDAALVSRFQAIVGA